MGPGEITIDLWHDRRPWISSCLFRMPLDWLQFNVWNRIFRFGRSEKNLEGNHLKKVLEKIVPSFDALKTVPWQQTMTKKIVLDPANITEPVMRGVDEKNE